jgi:putative chitinase
VTDLLSQVNATMLLAIGGPGITAKKAQRERIIAESASVLPDLMAEFRITTPLRILHFLAQLAHESDGFHTTEEYASGANYEGRSDLGNSRTGDGARFKGRGLIQVTGRANYRAFTRWMRSFMPNAPDFEAEPELLEGFPWAVWSATWYWDSRKLNVVADRDDLLTVTQVINGGKNGLADRSVKLARGKTYLAQIEGAAASTAQGGYRVLYRGIDGREVDVVNLQSRLKTAGYYFSALDGDFGSGTDNAVRTLQAKLGLRVDGVVGSKTWDALVKLTGAAR